MAGARYAKENFKHYKERIKAENKETKRYLRGRVVWVGQMGTMIKDKNGNMIKAQV